MPETDLVEYKSQLTDTLEKEVVAYSDNNINSIQDQKQSMTMVLRETRRRDKLAKRIKLTKVNKFPINSY